MRDVLRVAGIGLGIALACVVLAVAAYDLVVIGPAASQARAMLAAASPGDRQPPARLHVLLDAARNPRMSVVETAAWQLSWCVSPMNPPSAERTARALLWPALLRAHLSRDEFYALESTLAYNGVDHGIERLAMRRFGKPLEALTWDEAAEIVAILQAPSYMLRRPDALAKRKAWLLRAVGAPGTMP
jgi:hypothetical protein